MSRVVTSICRLAARASVADQPPAVAWTLDPGQEVADLQAELGRLSVVARAEVEYRPAAWTKNRTWRRGQGRVYLAAEARQARDDLALLLRQALGRRRLARNRAWAWMHAWKPSHDSDAHNATALVLDAVQLATDLDDRWLCLGPVTWSIDPARPRLRVWVGQADLRDALACRACGQVLPDEAFRGVAAYRDSATCAACAAGRPPRRRRPRRPRDSLGRLAGR